MHKKEEDEDEEEVNEMAKEALEYFIIPSLLESLARSILKHISEVEISHLLTEKKLNFILQERFGLTSLEKKIVEKHLFHTRRLKYSKAVIEGQGVKKDYKIMILGEEKFLEANKLREEHLMLFELEINKGELESGLEKVEGRKDFLENEI